MSLVGNGQKFKAKFIRGLLLLTITLGGLSAISLLRSPPIHPNVDLSSENIKKLEKEIASATAESSDRGPASLGVAQINKRLGKSAKASWTLSVACGNDSYNVPRVARVRLQGSACTSAAIKATEVRNATTGAEATVFDGKNSLYSTDFLFLQSGANDIEVTHTLQTGQQTKRKLLVFRND